MFTNDYGYTNANELSSRLQQPTNEGTHKLTKVDDQVDDERYNVEDSFYLAWVVRQILDE